jgi:ABC-type Mn2+/Zn2+ transport system permease subunit
MVTTVQLMYALMLRACIGGIAGYIESLMVTKSMALMGGAFVHLTLAEVALALLYGFDVSLGALLFLSIGIGSIWLLEQRTKLPVETLTVVVLPSSLAVTFLALPEDKTAQALIGDISQISLPAVTVTGALCAITFFLLKKAYLGLGFTSISEGLAQAHWIDVGKNHFVFLACIAVTVALGMRVVGGLLTAALVAITESASKDLIKNLVQYAYG